MYDMFLLEFDVVRESMPQTSWNIFFYDIAVNLADVKLQKASTP